MKMNKKERLVLDDLLSQLYGTVACHSSIDLADKNHRDLLEGLRIEIKNIKDYLEKGLNR